VLRVQWYSFVAASVMYLRIDRPCFGFIQELMWDLWWTKYQCGTLLSEGFTVHCHERSAVLWTA